MQSAGLERVLSKTGASEVRGPTDTERFTRGMTVAYLTALICLGALSIITYLIMQRSIEEQATDAAVLNVSGGERMLSQRIALLGLSTVSTNDAGIRQELQQHLGENVDLLERSHRGLLQGDQGLKLPGNPSPAVRTVYFDEPWQVDQTIRQFIQVARSIARSAPADLQVADPRLGQLTHAINAATYEPREVSNSLPVGIGGGSEPYSQG